MSLDNKLEDLRVLLVDDDKIPKVVLSRALKEMGINKILTADNGQQALQILFIQSIDLIVSDWNMPEMDGLELFNSVKTNDLLKSIPFLLLTSANSKDEVLKAAKAGVKNYIIKSNDTLTFKDKVNSILGLK